MPIHESNDQSQLTPEDQIRTRAHEIWLERGSASDGDDVQDWLLAEEEILGKTKEI